jgi:predicted GIY-YIG superfamily endonuclease
LKHVYLIRSVRYTGQSYVGITCDVDARLREHNAGRSPHTSKYAPWRLVVAVRFENDARAAAFERYLKSGSGRAFAKRHFR